MWPFKSSPEPIAPCKCDKACSDVRCKIISPTELRKLAAEGKHARIKDTLENIKEGLTMHAKANGVTPYQIRFKLEIEADVLEALAICGLSVNLASRKPWDNNIVFTYSFSDFYNTVEYEVTF